MKRMLWALLAGLALAGAAWAGDDAAGAENPYRKAAVGDWTRHEGKVTYPGNDGGAPIEASYRMYAQVTEKTDAAATLAYVYTAMVEGQAQSRPPHFVTVSLTDPYEPMSAFLKRLPEDAKVERGAAPDETLPVLGRDWKCKVVTVKVTAPERQSESEMKAWYSPEAPLSGLVRLDSKTHMTAGDQKIRNDAVMLLAAFGTAANPDPDAPSLEPPVDDDDAPAKPAAPAAAQ